MIVNVQRSLVLRVAPAPALTVRHPTLKVKVQEEP